MSNSIAPGSSADINVKVTALTTNPNVPTQYKTIILKKNLVNGVNTLTQEMMANQNIKYVIKYDYVLGENITVPDNCILEFDGGSILGTHTLTGNNTDIKGNINNIFDTITIDGTWIVSEISTLMFKDLSATNAIQNLFALQNENKYNKIRVEEGVYKVRAPYASWSGIIKLKNNTDLILNGTIQLETNNLDIYQILYVGSNVNIIGSGKIIGDRDTNTATGEHGHGIAILGKNVSVKNIEISKCFGDGIFIFNTPKNVEIDNCIIHDCRRQGISIIQASNVKISNTEIYNINGTAPGAAIDLEPNEKTQVIQNIIIENCYFHDCLKGIRVYDILNNLSIVNNRITNVSPISITRNIQPTTLRSKNIKISENTFIGGTGLTLDYIENAIISNNNIILDTESSDEKTIGGIYIANTNTLSIENNVIDLKNNVLSFNLNSTLVITKNTIKSNGIKNWVNDDGSETQNVNILLDWQKDNKAIIHNNIITGIISLHGDCDFVNNIVSLPENFTINYPVFKVVRPDPSYTWLWYTVYVEKNNFNFDTVIASTADCPMYMPHCKNGSINKNIIKTNTSVWNSYIGTIESSMEKVRNVFNGTLE